MGDAPGSPVTIPPAAAARPEADVLGREPTEVPAWRRLVLGRSRSCSLPGAALLYRRGLRRCHGENRGRAQPGAGGHQIGVGRTRRRDPRGAAPASPGDAAPASVQGLPGRLELGADEAGGRRARAAPAPPDGDGDARPRRRRGRAERREVRPVVPPPTAAQQPGQVGSRPARVTWPPRRVPVAEARARSARRQIEGDAGRGGGGGGRRMASCPCTR